MAGKAKSRKKKGRTLFGMISARALMLCAALLLGASYLSIWFNPAKAWFLTIFGLLLAPFALLNFCLLVWALLRRSRAFVIPLLALLPAAFLLKYYYQGGETEVQDEGDGIRIVSYNVGRFQSPARRLGIDGQKECADSVFARLRSLDADIICLQEYYSADPSRVGQQLSRVFPGYYIEYYVYPDSKGCYGNVTLSRYPFKSKDKIDFDKSSNLAIICDCRVGGENLRIYNCHFQSYSISLPYIATTIKGDYKEAVRYTGGKLRRSITLRPQQVDRVMESIEGSPVASIVAGDFNDTPASYTYHRLLKDRKDSFVEAGHGFGATYSIFRPFLRIDYVLFPQEYAAVSHEVLDWRYSDHYPIMTTIKIKDKNI